jgi:hypothetical protein
VYKQKRKPKKREVGRHSPGAQSRLDKFVQTHRAEKEANPLPLDFYRPIYLPNNLWEILPSYGNLYVYTRMLDKKGAGVVTFNTDFAAGELYMMPRTCKDYVRTCLRKGLFRHIEWLDRTTVKVYYNSMPKLMLGLEAESNTEILLEGPEDILRKKS